MPPIDDAGEPKPPLPPVDGAGDPNGEAAEAVAAWPNGDAAIEEPPNTDCSGLGTLPNTLAGVVVEGVEDAPVEDNIPNPPNADVAEAADPPLLLLKIFDEAADAAAVGVAAAPPKILPDDNVGAGLPNVDIEKRFWPAVGTQL